VGGFITDRTGGRCATVPVPVSTPLFTGVWDKQTVSNVESITSLMICSLAINSCTCFDGTFNPHSILGTV
jgi:hypothetical protein